MTDRSSRHLARPPFCRAAWVAAPLLLAACTAAGTETDNPLLAFEGSSCKDGEAGAELTALTTAPASTAGDAPAEFMAGPEYDGLFCIAWSAGASGQLRVDLYNHRGGCHAEWDGHARRHESGVDLDLEVVGCAIAGCGACIYDLSFALTDVDVSAPLHVDLSERSCSDSPDEEIAAVTLPLDEQSSGVLCRPTPRALVGLRPLCGTAHLPVCAENGTTDCSAADAPPCADGLACAEVEGVDVCLSACEEDADCPLEIEACNAGVCRLRETF